MALTQATQFSMDSSITIVYYDGRITTSVDGMVFECDVPKSFKIKSSITIEELKQDIYQKIIAESRRVAEIYYRCPMFVANGHVQYMNMIVLNDGDIQRMFDAFSDHASNGPIELYAILVRSTDEIIDSLLQPKIIDEIIASLHQPQI